MIMFDSKYRKTIKNPLRSKWQEAKLIQIR